MLRHLTVVPDIEVSRPLIPHDASIRFNGVREAILQSVQRAHITEHFNQSVILVNMPRVQLVPPSEVQTAARTSFYKKLGAHAVTARLEEALNDYPTRFHTIPIKPLEVDFIDHGNSVEAGFIVEENILWDEEQIAIDTLSALTHTRLHYPRPMLTFAHLYDPDFKQIVKAGAERFAPPSLILNAVEIHDFSPQDI